MKRRVRLILKSEVVRSLDLKTIRGGLLCTADSCDGCWSVAYTLCNTCTAIVTESR